MVEPVALLIDAQNVAPSRLPEILRLAAGLGPLQIRRAYHDARISGEWGKTDGIRLIHAGEGKNAADLLLSIDAMELALRDGIRAFVLVSSDGDFSHLAFRLQETGRMVLGIGEAKAPERFRATCTVFQTLSAAPVAKPVPMPVIVPVSSPLPATKPKQAKAVVLSALDQAVRDVIIEHGPAIRIGFLGSTMGQKGFKLETLPAKNWRTYLEGNPSLYNLDPQGPDAMVRLRPVVLAVVS